MPSTVESSASLDQQGARPPWGLQTPKPKHETGTKNEAFLSTYDRMFKGWKGSPAKPVRHRTAPHFPNSMWRDHSSYQETFRTPHRYSRHEVKPASENRHHKPHPSQLIWPLEPNKSYMIWKPASDRTPAVRPTESAPPTLTQFNRLRQMNTTYKDVFKGYQTVDLLNNLPANTKTARPMTDGNVRNSLPATVSGQRTRPATEEERLGSRPATYSEKADNSVYQQTFQGDYGRPSTIERAPDRSWANIRY